MALEDGVSLLNRLRMEGKNSKADVVLGLDNNLLDAASKTELFAKIIEQVDYILFDMKHWNSKKHKEGTGIYNELILSNMTYAVKSWKKSTSKNPCYSGLQ